MSDPLAHTSPPRAPTLPLGWDPARDLFVWIGSDPAPPDSTPPERFLIYLPPGNLGPLPGGAHLLRSPSELFQAILALPGALPAHVLVHRGGGVAPALHQDIARTVQGALRSKALQMRTVAASGTTWLLQGLANLPALADHPSIAPLRGSFAGAPCLLVSPGPSLAKNIGQLRQLKGRALIVSGTHSLHALSAAGIVPDLTVCADPGDLGRHWDGVPLEGVEAFVAGATCRPETFTAGARRLFSFASNGRLDDWIFEPLGERAVLATGGSVSCSQLSLALHLGCDPIAFVGQDLSFTDRFYVATGLDGDAQVELAGQHAFVLKKPEGAQGPGTTLADGSVQFTIPQPILEVPGWAGGTVRTTPTLKAFLDWFEAVAGSLHGSPRLFNCTEGGAHIAGLEHLPLAQVAREWRAKLAAGDILDRARSGFDPAGRRERLARSVRETIRSLEEGLRLADRCRSLAGRSLDQPSRLEELARLEQRLGRALRGARMVSLVAQDEITGAREAARLAPTLDQNLAAAQRLYEVVERAGRLLRAPLREALARLASGSGKPRSDV